MPPWALIYVKDFLPVKEHLFMNLYREFYLCGLTVKD